MKFRCVNCPVQGQNGDDCDAQYRGSRCAALCANAGVDFDPWTQAEHISSSVELLARYGVYACVPSGCCTPAWYGHFDGFAKTEEEAIQREVEWLRRPMKK